MHGTPASIFWRAWVMFSIWLSKNTGSTVPSHSYSSIRYGILPRGQRAVLAFRKVWSAASDPRGCGARAMSPSMIRGVSESDGTGAKAPRRGGRDPLDVAKNPRHRRQRIIILAGSDQHLVIFSFSCWICMSLCHRALTGSAGRWVQCKVWLLSQDRSRLSQCLQQMLILDFVDSKRRSLPHCVLNTATLDRELILKLTPDFFVTERTRNCIL